MGKHTIALIQINLKKQHHEFSQNAQINLICVCVYRIGE